MKKSKRVVLFLLLVSASGSGQDLIHPVSHEKKWSLLYFSYYDPEILSSHSFGIGFGTEDVTLSAGFSYGKHLLAAGYNYYTDNRNYFEIGDSYGAFFRPEAELFQIGKRVTLSANCLLNYSFCKLGFSFQVPDSSGAIVGYEHLQNTHTLDFFYGLNAKLLLFKNFRLGAGVLMKFFSCYAGQVILNDFSTNTTSVSRFGYNGPNDLGNRWIFPSVFIRYDLSFRR